MAELKPVVKMTEGQKAFIGTTFPTPKGGLLTVVGIKGKQGSHVLFEVECSTCSEDKVLYPKGFSSQKADLKRGYVPCGCGHRANLDNRQAILSLQRLCDDLPLELGKGRLLVKEVVGKSNSNNRRFSVECTICSKDKVLFPLPFTITKESIIKGRMPCGCSKISKLSDRQDILSLQRICDTLPVKLGVGRLSVLSVIGKGNKRRFTVECSICSRDQILFPSGTFKSSKSNIVRGYAPCGCSKNHQWSQGQYAIRLKRLLSQEKGIFLGWSEGKYKGHKTKFKWECVAGHQNQTESNAFLSAGTRCMTCYQESAKHISNGSGYYPQQLDRIDTLYLLELGDPNNPTCLKVGRTFESRGNDRYKEIQKGTSLKVNKYRIITAPHSVIYAIEQGVVNKYKGKPFKRYDHPFSNEMLKLAELERVEAYLDACCMFYESQIISDLYY